MRNIVFLLLGSFVWTLFLFAIPAWADDSDYYRIVPCKFQILDKLGRSVKCPEGTTLAFQLKPETVSSVSGNVSVDIGDKKLLYLNGKVEIELGDIVIDTNTWRDATISEDGIAEVELMAPVSDSSGIASNYKIRFNGSESLKSCSLASNSFKLTSRGTAHDIEPLYLKNTVRQTWEKVMMISCSLLSLFWGWLYSAKVRAKIWAVRTSKGDVNCDSIANRKRRFIMAITIVVTLIGVITAIFYPGVTGFFPYCGVVLGSLAPLVLLMIMSVFG